MRYVIPFLLLCFALPAQHSHYRTLVDTPAVERVVVPDGDSYQFVRITFPHGGVRKWTNVTNYREIPNDEGVTVMFNGVDEDGNTVAVNLSLTPGGMIEKGPPM